MMKPFHSFFVFHATKSRVITRLDRVIQFLHSRIPTFLLFNFPTNHQFILRSHEWNEGEEEPPTTNHRGKSYDQAYVQ